MLKEELISKGRYFLSLSHVVKEPFLGNDTWEYDALESDSFADFEKWILDVDGYLYKNSTPLKYEMFQSLLPVSSENGYRISKERTKKIIDLI